MRKLFLIVVIALALASVCTVLSLRSKADRPVLVWATGICPERYEQAELFRKWLVRNGHTAPDGGPVCDIELQASDQQSSLIQAVSGMGSDLIDRIAVERFAPMGVLEDITEFARENGLNPERNYGPAAELLTCEGRQYVYPCNLACYGLLVNVDTFEKVGMAAPPEEWTPEEFERIGLEFTRRANAGKPRQEVFFCAWTPMMLQIARSRGADVFNETLTAAKLNRTEFIDAVKLQHKWTEIDHLMPTAAERAGDHSRQSVNNDASLLFASGRYAMFLTGRYANMDLRRMKQPVRQSFSQLPQFGFKNMRLLARGTGIYRGTKYPEYAKLFLLFLADREYNNQIITGADGLPPNPAFAENNPEYLTDLRRPSRRLPTRNGSSTTRSRNMPPPPGRYGSDMKPIARYSGKSTNTKRRGKSCRPSGSGTASSGRGMLSRGCLSKDASANVSKKIIKQNSRRLSRRRHRHPAGLGFGGEAPYALVILEM